MSNTLKDIILFKRSNQESIITENLLPEDILEGEVVLCYEKDKERLYCKNKDGIITPIHRVLDGEDIEIAYATPVDLGLPSGNLWAKGNLGALTETDYGLYYQWGDTVGYTKEQVGTDKVFDWNNYKWSVNGSDSNFSKYNSSDGKTVLDLEDDAVYAALGGNWKMPTVNDWRELYNNTTRQWAQINGVKGYKLTSSNGNYIFLPAAGRGDGSSLNYDGSDGNVWSSSLFSVGSPGAFYCGFYRDGLNPNSSQYYYRYRGFSVRGILTTK